MGIFRQFPYTNFHDLNLDWILKNMRKLLTEWAEHQEKWEVLYNDVTTAFDDFKAVFDEHIAQYDADFRSFIDSIDINKELRIVFDQAIADGTVASIINPVIATKTSEWLATNITEPVGVVIDKSLTVDGACADAKATGDLIAKVTSDLNVVEAEISTFEDYQATLLSRGAFDRDAYNPETHVVGEFKYRISSRKAISFPYDITLDIASGFRFYPYYEINGTWTGQGWKTGTFKIDANKQFYAQIARSTEDPSEIADVAVFLEAIKVHGNPTYVDIATLKEKQELYGSAFDFGYNDYTEIDVVQGGYGVSNGKITISTDSTRLRSNKIYKVTKGEKVIFRGFNVQCYIAELSDLYSASILANSGWLSNSATRVESVYTVLNDCYIYLNFRFGDNSNITPSDYTDAYNNYTFITNGFAYNVPAKAVHVYHFGGDGNDWCFVRTPSGYDPKRAKPYPFVICNHGNGWVMDGTIKYANWTKRTMYVPLDDPDFIADPSEYNGTNDVNLQYSNPTIEALLTAGYIVCGCENYGDNLYGNNDCRNACADFFYHMITHYNVEKRCYMIGASNGALTALNASYLLQGAVKALILQYPLTCLVNQYESYPEHQSAIRTAYGITDADITEAELTKAVATHDPLTVDVVSGQKVGAFPPTKLYYSQSDAIANYQQNTIALATMLDNSNKVVATVQCSGEHGDHSHFAPADYVEWFNDN